MQSSAIENYNRIGDLIQQLEKLYNQVNNSRQNFENSVSGVLGYGYNTNYIRTSTYTQQMEFIRIFLKQIANEDLTDQERQHGELMDLPDALKWSEMSSYLRAMIEWLRNIHLKT